MSNLFRLSRALPRITPRLATARPALIAQPARLAPITLATRFYSAEKAPLTAEQVEGRVLQLLKDFDKVDAAKVG